MAVHVHLITSTISYSVAFLSGLVTCVCIGLSKASFGGVCILFATVELKEKKLWVENAASPCNAAMYMQLGALFFALCLAVYNGYACFASRRDPHISRTMWVMPCLLSNTLLTLLLFISSIMTSVGSHLACKRLLETTKYTSCREAFTLPSWEKITKTQATTAYNSLSIAGISTWVCSITWVVLLALTVVRYLRNRKARSAQTYDEPELETSVEQSDKVEIANLPPTA